MSRNRQIPIGTTTTSKLRYWKEDAGANPSPTEVSVTERDWPVTDPEARAKAAEREIGPLDDDYNERNVMWYIDAERNAAALLVFRHRSSPSRVREVVAQ